MCFLRRKLVEECVSILLKSEQWRRVFLNSKNVEKIIKTLPADFQDRLCMLAEKSNTTVSSPVELPKQNTTVSSRQISSKKTTPNDLGNNEGLNLPFFMNV